MRCSFWFVILIVALVDASAGPVSQRGASSVVTSPSQLLIPAPPGVLSVMAVSNIYQLKGVRRFKLT